MAPKNLGGKPTGKSTSTMDSCILTKKRLRDQGKLLLHKNQFHHTQNARNKAHVKYMDNFLLLNYFNTKPTPGKKHAVH